MKKEYLDRMRKDLSKKDFNAYISSFDCKEKHGFTINLKKLSKSSISLQYVLDRFKGKLVYKNENYAYIMYDKYELERYGISPGKDPLYHVGLYYIQEPSAAKVLYDVDVKESDVVLDLCASPGGKSCEVLYNLDKKSGGFLIANEIKNDRAKILSSNIERMGFDNVIVTNNKVMELSERFIDFFDKIIVDAPCSGEGMFRKSEAARNQWSKKLVTTCASIQKELLDYSYKMLKNNGVLIYSTCTFSKEEDEENVEYILKKYSEFSLLHMEKNYPFNSEGEGQFFAIFKKADNNSYFKSKFPDLNDLKGLHLLRYGIKKYEDVNGREMPTHASTHVDDIDIFEYKIELSDEEIMQYLHGDVIRKNVEFNEYCKVTYKGLGVGLAKAVNGVLKNHYPKGLRNS